MEHQTPSGFPGNFRKRKVLGTLWFPSGLPETLGKANPEREIFSNIKQTTLTLTGHLGPGALFTRARDVQTGLPGESEWRGSRLAQQTEREMRSAWWDIKESEYLGE